MSNLSFRLMSASFAVLDAVHPYIDKRVEEFGLPAGAAVVDYGCGPGRYTVPFARTVGPKGLVYAVDVQELALAAVKRRAARAGLQNVLAVLARGYRSGLPDHVADVVCALDMFHGIREPVEFLAELHRVTKPDGALLLDDGHQDREVTKAKVESSGLWVLDRETADHLVYCFRAAESEVAS
jgi:ubiquinone/menaquinone biosynthesis C-methylase UbiE